MFDGPSPPVDCTLERCASSNSMTLKWSVFAFTPSDRRTKRKSMPVCRRVHARSPLQCSNAGSVKPRERSLAQLL
jgi:hypothetical protein